jgi:hypothetical protein
MKSIATYINEGLLDTDFEDKFDLTLHSYDNWKGNIDHLYDEVREGAMGIYAEALVGQRLTTVRDQLDKELSATVNDKVRNYTMRQIDATFKLIVKNNSKDIGTLANLISSRNKVLDLIQTIDQVGYKTFKQWTYPGWDNFKHFTNTKASRDAVYDNYIKISNVEDWMMEGEAQKFAKELAKVAKKLKINTRIYSQSNEDLEEWVIIEYDI